MFHAKIKNENPTVSLHEELKNPPNRALARLSRIPRIKVIEQVQNSTAYPGGDASP